MIPSQNPGERPKPVRMNIMGQWGDLFPEQMEVFGPYGDEEVRSELSGKFYPNDTRDPRRVLLETADLLEGGRAKDYGSPLESHKRIAAIWSAQLGVTVTPRKVAQMMAGLKLARLAESPDHDDSWRDAIGYLALGSSFPEGQA